MADPSSPLPPGRAHRRKQPNPHRASCDGPYWEPNPAPQPALAPAQPSEVTAGDGPASGQTHQQPSSPAPGDDTVTAQPYQHNTRHKGAFTPFKQQAPSSGSPTTVKAGKAGANRSPRKATPVKIPFKPIPAHSIGKFTRTPSPRKTTPEAIPGEATPEASPSKTAAAGSPGKPLPPAAAQAVRAPKAARQVGSLLDDDKDWKPGNNSSSSSSSKGSPHKGGPKAPRAATPEPSTSGSPKRTPKRHGPCCNPLCGDPWVTPQWREGPGNTTLCNACGVKWGRAGKPDDLALLRDPSPAKSRNQRRRAAKKKNRRSRLGPGAEEDAAADSGDSGDEAAMSWEQEAGVGEGKPSQGVEAGPGQEAAVGVGATGQGLGPADLARAQVLVTEAFTHGGPAALQAAKACQLSPADASEPYSIGSGRRLSSNPTASNITRSASPGAAALQAAMAPPVPASVMERSSPGLLELGMAASEPPSGDNHVTPFSSIQMPLANSSIHPGSRRMGARGPGASGDPPRRRGAPSDSVATDHDMWEGGDEEAPGDAAGDAGRGGAFAGPHLHLERGTGSTYRSLFGREAGGAAGGRVDACLMPPGFAGAGRPLGPDDTPMDEKEGGRQEGLRPVPHDELELQDGEDVEEWASAVLAGLKAQEPARQPSQDPKRCVSLQDWLPPTPGDHATGDVPNLTDPADKPQQTPNSDPSAGNTLTAGRQFDPNDNSNCDASGFDFKAACQQAGGQAGPYHQTTHLQALQQGSAPGQAFPLPGWDLPASRARQGSKSGSSGTSSDDLGDAPGDTALAQPHPGRLGGLSLDPMVSWSPERAEAALLAAVARESGAQQYDKHNQSNDDDELGLLPAVHTMMNQSNTSEGGRDRHSTGTARAQPKSTPGRKRKAGAGVGSGEEAGKGAAGDGGALPVPKRGRTSSSETEGPTGLRALMDS